MNHDPDDLRLKIAEAILGEYQRLRSELKIGWVTSTNVQEIVVAVMDADDSSLQFSKVDEGAYGECFRVETTENSFPDCKEVVQGGFLAKKLKGGGQQEIYKEAARLLLITSLGHYGIVESQTFEKDGKNAAFVLCQYDSSENITVYVTMKIIEGKTLEEGFEQLTDFDKLRIVVRVADTLNFLHSYKLAHCDLNFSNIMLTQENHDPVLIDLGSMRSNLDVDYTPFDTSSFLAMIQKMYRNCKASEIPPVVKPLFDKWDDPDHCQMSVDTLVDKYFGDLAAYNTIFSVTIGGSDTSNTIPCRQDGGLFVIDFRAMQESRSFAEYFERTVMKLEEQDTRIRKYLDLSKETKNKHPALKPPFKCENVDGLHCFSKTREYQQFCELVRQKLHPNETVSTEEDQP